MIRCVIFIFAVFVGLGFLKALNAHDLQIKRQVHLKTTTEVSSQNICLSDLVSESWLYNRCAIDRNICCRWSLDGKIKKEFSRIELSKEVSHIDLGGIHFELIGSDQITVTQNKRALRVEEIRSRLVTALSLRATEPGIEVQVKNIKILVPILVLLSEENDWDIQLPDALDETNNIRIVSTKDLATVLGWLQAALSFKGTLFVANKTIKLGEPIQTVDFELKQVEVSPTNGNTYFSKVRFPEFTRARVTIQRGTPLHSGAIERIPLVRLGDAVTLILRSDNLSVATKGVVQGSAAVGDMVTVQLPRYNRTFRGRLLEGRRVEVWL